MTFYEKYLIMCNKKGVSPSAAAVQSGVTKTSVYRWKRGSVPTDATILSLCDFFNCKPKDLLPDDMAEVSINLDTKTDNMQTDGLERLKEDERTLLDSYRTMDDAAQFAMQVFAKGLRRKDVD